MACTAAQPANPRASTGDPRSVRSMTNQVERGSLVRKFKRAGSLGLTVIAAAVAAGTIALPATAASGGQPGSN